MSTEPDDIPLREQCDLISAQLGARVSARSSMPGSGAPARMAAEPPKRTLMQRIRAYLTGA